MKITPLILLILISFYSITPIQAQEASMLNRKEIGLQIGWRFNRILDKRYASNAKKMGQAIYALRYAEQHEKKREELVFSYSTTPKNSNPGFLSFKTTMPQVNYSYQRKVGNAWVGGFFDSFTLLTFPKSSTGVFGNNSISYTIVGSLGAAIGYEHKLNETEENPITLHSSAQLSLLNYVIRPAYGHPYPEQYLTEENFSPTRAGMAGPLFKSGKLKTLNTNQMLRLVIGFNYYHKNRLKLGIQYEFYGQNNVSRQRSNTLMQDILFSASYLYGK